MVMNGARLSNHGSQQHCAAHEYPPQAFTSTVRAENIKHRPLYCSSEPLADYLIHTDAQDVHGARLQVSPFPAHNSGSTAPTPPIFVRERTLTANNEIVDNIIDARFDRVCWTVHRPTRGWYLYLRSPSLAKGAAISLTSAKTVEYDASISPLTFSLTTVLQQKSLAHVKTCIDTVRPKSTQISTSHVQREVSDSPISADAHSIASNASAAGTDMAVATGREDPTVGERGHTRKRSAAGSGTHSVADRKQNRKSLALSKSPMIPEVQDEGGFPHSSRGHFPTIQASATPSFRADADLPYSPAKPDNHRSGGGRSPLHNETNGEQRLCTFVLCDGNRRPERKSLSAANTDQSVSLQGPQSWARWAWSILPQELRPELPSGTNKNFGVYWIDASPDIGNMSSEAIEILRFQDQSGWWMWNSQTKGKLTLQTKAIEALGLEHEFCITIALAYVQFLEERDSYEAARYA